MGEKRHKSVILFSEWKKPLRILSLEQKGRILDALLDFPDGIPPKFDDPMLVIAWEFMQGGLEENARKWDEIREKRSAAGKKGAEATNAKHQTAANPANADFARQAAANPAVSGSVSVSGSGSVSGSVSGSGSAKEIESSSSSDSICDDLTTTSLEDEFRESIGKLTEKGRKELSAYSDRMGEDLVRAVIAKCADLGAHSWAYVRKALTEAEAQGCTSAEEYRKTNPIGAGRNLRVDRKTPSGNDFLKDAGRRRMKKKGEQSA